jgi:uracil-DNA glycosylase family protein
MKKSPAQKALEHLATEARTCRACELYKEGTQTVFGRGPAGSELFFVGEQPGDQEDLTGEPFVGPAGKLLRRALEAAGLDAAKAYVTNAVKHFHWKPAGKRRLHQKPRPDHIAACHPWLEAEIHQVEPRLIICLGATAARAVFGRVMAVEANFGKELESPFGIPAYIVKHPSALLRIPDRADQEAAFASYVEFFTKLAKDLGPPRSQAPLKSRRPASQRASRREARPS